MDLGESGSTETSLCPDLSALKKQEAILNKRKAESPSYQNLLQTCTDLCTTDARSSARFGALSHHSFFSRHNPHPQRVTHMQGESFPAFQYCTNKAIFSELSHIPRSALMTGLNSHWILIEWAYYFMPILGFLP